jgi:hypothetical protein
VALRPGSALSEAAVGGSEGGLNSDPHALQNLWPAAFAASQLGQLTLALSGFPQFPQNRASAAFSCPHEVQSMVDPY